MKYGKVNWVCCELLYFFWDIGREPHDGGCRVL